MKHIISTLVLTLPLVMAAQTPILVKTFPNPTPVEGEFFGWAMAPLGNDRVLVGAPYVADSPPGGGFTYSNGEAYLFSTNGTLLNTFTNPTPQNEDLFGNAIATIGNDLILIAAYGDNAETEDAGVIHLFATNGALLNTITNPQPTNGACFGYSLAVVGNDRILAGVPGELWFAGPASAGAAYLISTNGALLATFTNPAPTLGDNFGATVATVGTEYILIGAPGDDQGALDAGRAYLFRTNGALVTAFDNPTPGTNDQFSFRLSAFDKDRVLIGTPRDSSAASMAGAAYLFHINGTLLKTFTQNTVNQNFGIPTALGNLVLVGAPSDNTGAAGAGAAYLYTTNGTLVATITNPAPASADHFGYKFVPVGSDRVLISGEWEAGSVGAVYLYSLPPPPSLTIRRTGSTTVAVSWPATASNFVLQQNTNSLSSINWSNVTSGIVNDGTTKTLVINPASGARFYRLVPAQEDGTITISSTFYMDWLYGTVGPDLAEVFANGHEHTWTLTLHGTSQSHETFTNPFGVTEYATEIHATSFDLEFFGPDAATLNGIVSEHIAGGDVFIYLANDYSSGIGNDFAVMYVEPTGPDFQFYSDCDVFGCGTLFPTDADGYPVVGPDPFSIWNEYSALIDNRPGNDGYIQSRYSLVTFEGSVGVPEPGVLAVADASVLEGGRGTSKVTVPVALSNGSSQAITVSYRIVDGTAKATGDYMSTSGTLTFQPGETSRTISVSIKGDRKREANETFSVQLSNAVGATICDGVATGTILNDD